MSLRPQALSLILLPFALSAQWTPIASGLQSIRSMTQLGTDLYAATYPSGVKKSTNGGTTWNPVNTGLPTSGSNIFCESVGDNDAYLFAGTQSGVYRSNNGGALWEAANGTLAASSTVFANKWFQFSGVTMAVFAGNIANGGGIWRTGNNGTTWFIGHSGMGSNVTVHHLTLVGATLYASTTVGLYTSSDNGLNWAVHPVVNYATYSLAQVGSTLVITSTFGYRYSTDGGTTWMDATGDPSAPGEGELVVYDGILYANTGTSTGCLRSTDSGLTWAAYNTGLGVVDVSSLEEFHAAGTRLYVTALFDIYYVTGIGLDIPAAGNLEHVTIAPTIFLDHFTVNDPDGDMLQIELIDGGGRTVRLVRTQGATTVVDRGDLPHGTYRLRSVDGDGRVRDMGAVIAQ